MITPSLTARRRMLLMSPHSDQPLCRLDELPIGETRGFNYAGYPLFAIAQHGNVFLYHNRCPHLGVELNLVENEFLDIEGSYFQCSTHGALFTIEEGFCVSGPCRGRHLQAVPYKVSHGAIYPLLP